MTPLTTHIWVPTKITKFSHLLQEYQVCTQFLKLILAVLMMNQAKNSLYTIFSQTPYETIDHSPGLDNIHAKIIKCTYNLFLDQLTHICNLSLMQGVFPNELKIARVVPLYKADNNMLVNNYRPVSVLPVFSKILERLMYNRLYAFIIKHDIFYKYQFGFQKGHSTNMALIVLVDKIMSALDNGDIVLGVFIDLSKAFDTVNHTI